MEKGQIDADRDRQANLRRPVAQPVAAQNLSFNSRALAKIETVSSARPGSIFLRLARSSGLLVRRNGWNCFSSPMVDGMVYLPSARTWRTHSYLLLSSWLLGSSVKANLRFFSVYSWPQ